MSHPSISPGSPREALAGSPDASYRDGLRSVLLFGAATITAANALWMEALVPAVRADPLANQPTAAASIRAGAVVHLMVALVLLSSTVVKVREGWVGTVTRIILAAAIVVLLLVGAIVFDGGRAFLTHGPDMRLTGWAMVSIAVLDVCLAVSLSTHRWLGRHLTRRRRNKANA